MCVSSYECVCRHMGTDAGVGALMRTRTCALRETCKGIGVSAHLRLLAPLTASKISISGCVARRGRGQRFAIGSGQCPFSLLDSG